MTIPLIVRGFLLKVFSFWIVGVMIGYILTDGLKIKLNTGFRWGIVNMLVMLVLVPLLIPILSPVYSLPIVFLIFSLVNGYHSNKKNLFKNFGFFMIPVAIYTLAFFVMDSSTFSQIENFYPFFYILVASVIGILIGYIFGKRNCNVTGDESFKKKGT